MDSMRITAGKNTDTGSFKRAYCTQRATGFNAKQQRWKRKGKKYRNLYSDSFCRNPVAWDCLYSGFIQKRNVCDEPENSSDYTALRYFWNLLAVKRFLSFL